MSSKSAELMEHDLFGAPPKPYARRGADGALGKRMRELSRPDMVRVAPDRQAWIPAEHVNEPPEFCLCRWTRTSQGNFAPIPVAGRWVRLTEALAASLGFTDGKRRRRYETLMRLGRAGFIDLLHLSPGCWMLDLDSWFRHLAECAENPEMWEEGSEERQTYLHLNGLGGWKRKS